MSRRSFGIRMATVVGAGVLLAQGSALAAGAPIGLTNPVQATKANVDPGEDVLHPDLRR